MRRHRLMFIDQPVQPDPGPGAAGAGAPAAEPAAPAAPASVPSPADLAAAIAAAQAAATATPPAPPAAPAPAPESERVEDLPQWAQKLIHDARAEAATHRVKGKSSADDAQAALVQQIGKALGLVADEQPVPDAAELTAQLAAQQAAARDAQVKLAVHLAAAGAGADPNALLDSTAFLSSLAQVDPADTAAVTAAIKAAITTNPRLAATPAVARSGIDLAGGTGESATTQLSLGQALRSHYAA